MNLSALPVGLGPVGAGAEAADTQCAASDRMDERAIPGAVIGQQLLDGHPVTSEERDGARKERNDGRGLLIAEDLRVGQPGAIVDRDVDTLPASRAAPHAIGALSGHSAAVTAAARNAARRATLDLAQLLDVDVDQLTRPLSLVANSGLEAEASELAHADPREDPRDRGERHPERLGDLRACEAQPTQGGDRLYALLIGAVRDRAWCRGAVEQPELAFHAVAPDPLAGAADADFGGLGRLRQRPSLINYSPAQLPTTIQTECSVSVEVHPVSSLGLSRLVALSLQGGPDGPTYSGTTARAPGSRDNRPREESNERRNHEHYDDPQDPSG